MSGAAPSRAPWFAALVALVALWPLAHRGLVAAFAIDPWKLGGFAMYTTWQTTLVAVFEATPTGPRLVDEAALPREARRALEDFRARRSALGRLVSPDAAIRTLHAARPDLVSLVVVVQRLWLDRETARIDQAKETWLYESGERFEPAGPARGSHGRLPVARWHPTGERLDRRPSTRRRWQGGAAAARAPQAEAEPCAARAGDVPVRCAVSALESCRTVVVKLGGLPSRLYTADVAGSSR